MPPSLALGDSEGETLRSQASKRGEEAAEETRISLKHVPLAAGVSSVMDFSSLWIYIFRIFYQKTCSQCYSP